MDPEFFQLSVNYRCHSGIVKAAAFLVHLIISYFAYSIDPLIPEASPVDVGFWAGASYCKLTLLSYRSVIKNPCSC